MPASHEHCLFHLSNTVIHPDSINSGDRSGPLVKEETDAQRDEVTRLGYIAASDRVSLPPPCHSLPDWDGCPSAQELGYKGQRSAVVLPLPAPSQ